MKQAKSLRSTNTMFRTRTLLLFILVGLTMMCSVIIGLTKAPQSQNTQKLELETHKYLKFALCGGTTNQRMGFVSAALISKALNRKLIEPDIRSRVETTKSVFPEHNYPFHEIFDADMLCKTKDTCLHVVNTTGMYTCTPRKRAIFWATEKWKQILGHNDAPVLNIGCADQTFLPSTIQEKTEMFDLFTSLTLQTKLHTDVDTIIRGLRQKSGEFDCFHYRVDIAHIDDSDDINTLLDVVLPYFDKDVPLYVAYGLNRTTAPYQILQSRAPNVISKEDIIPGLDMKYDNDVDIIAMINYDVCRESRVFAGFAKSTWSYGIHAEREALGKVSHIMDFYGRDQNILIQPNIMASIPSPSTYDTELTCKMVKCNYNESFTWYKCK